MTLETMISSTKRVSELGIEFTKEDRDKFGGENYLLGCRSDPGEQEQPSYREGDFHRVNERAHESLFSND
jgi:hypothetical protein